MLRYLTHKLKTQSLNEAESYTPKNDDDHDSGTESDDEGADAEELEKYMDDSLQCDDGSSAPSDRASSTLDTITDTTEGTPGPPDSALPSDCDLHHHSSEEELEGINGGPHHPRQHPEKRKWSSRLSAGAAGSSDDELTGGLPEFRASPPSHALPRPSLSPPAKLFHAALPPHELCAVSPRKRHRRALLQPPAEPRPSLDFEKMQQNRRRRATHPYGKSYKIIHPL